MGNNNKFEKGIEFLKTGAYQEAIQVFTDLIQEFPNSAEFYSERGVTYFHLKQGKEAIADMNKAVELEPNKSYRYSSRAFILGHFGKTREAIADYQKAIDLDPEDSIAYNNMGLLQEQLGYQKEAKSNYSKADKLAKEKPEIGRTDLNIEGENIQARNIQKEIDAENKTMISELKDIFTKEGRASFGRFIKSGFKKT